MIIEHGGQKIGWNTWASSPPKDYLAKFCAAGGPDQIVMVDDLLPAIYQYRSQQAQRHVTDLYTQFISQTTRTMGYEAVIQPLSEHFQLADFIALCRQVTVADIHHALPADKRHEFSDLPLRDFVHVPMELYAHTLMCRQKTKKILRGNGQLGLTQISPDGVVYDFIDATKPTETYLQSNLDKKQTAKVMELLTVWRNAHLLKGTTHIEHVAEFYEQISPMRRRLLEALTFTFSGLPETTFMVSGSTAQLIAKDSPSHTSDIDCVIVADQITIPDGFACVPQSVNDAFVRGTIPVVTLKAELNGIKISLRFLRNSLVDNYFQSREPVLTWRQDPLYNRGEKGIRGVDAYGNFHEVDFGERPYFEGGSIHDQPRFIGDVPLLDTNTHLILSGRVLADTGCHACIKLTILHGLKQNLPGAALLKQVPQNLIKARPISQDTLTETQSLTEIVASM